MDSFVLGGPGWKVVDEDTGGLSAPLTQSSANQPERSEGQVPEQLENPIRSPLGGNVFGVVRT